jgi:hypothetical protein
MRTSTTTNTMRRLFTNTYEENQIRSEVHDTIKRIADSYSYSVGVNRKFDPTVLNSSVFYNAPIYILVQEIFDQAIHCYHDYGKMKLLVDLFVSIAGIFQNSNEIYELLIRSLVNCCGVCASTRFKTDKKVDLEEYNAKNFGEIMLVALMFQRRILSPYMLDHIVTRRLYKEFTRLNVEGQRTDVQSVCLLLLCGGEYFDQLLTNRRNRVTYYGTSSNTALAIIEDNNIELFYQRLESIANDKYSAEHDEVLFNIVDRYDREEFVERDNGTVVNRETRSLIRAVLKIRSKGWGLSLYELQNFIDTYFFDRIHCSSLFRWNRLISKDSSISIPFSDCDIVTLLDE